MSLPEALAFAHAHQLRIRAALARVAAQKEDADVPRSQWLPTVGVTAQLFAATANNTTGGYVSPGGIDIPRIGGTRAVSSGTWQPYATSFVGAGVNQELFDFGRIAAQSAAADARIDVERQRARSAELDVTFDVEEAYFAVLASKSVVKASEDAYERARAHRDLAKAGVDAGMRSPIELTRAEADLTRFDIGRVRARGGLAVARTTFAAAIGSDEASLDAGPAPATPPDLPLLDGALRRAAERDPRLLALRAEIHAEEQRTRAIGAELRPELLLTGTISGRAGGAAPSGNGEPAEHDGWLPNVPNWDAGIVLRWPLFDGTVHAREAVSRAREQVRREELADARHDEAAAVRTAYGSVQVARDALPGLQRAVDASRANYAQAEARFRSGLGTSVELADAEALRTDAEIQLALGQFQLARARAVLGRAIAEDS
ncbi:TolC family protein [Pendulispora rubella]|uniref:TolC family protein n=1 Tax=Pendulispora rubella TaxID=2741070 RepID=A0ABZ2LFF0_9BACT